MKTYITILILTLLMSVNLGKANIFYSISKGNWTSLGMWSHTSGGSLTLDVPGQTDTIYIQSDVTLNLDMVMHSGGMLVIAQNATLHSIKYSLEFKNNAFLEVYGTLIVRNLTFDNTCTFILAENATITVNGDFKNKNNSVAAILYGSMTILGSFYNGNGSILGGCGSIYISGSYDNTGTTFGVTGGSGIGPKDFICNPLPVELVEYSVQCDNGNATFRWSTASEYNNDYFTVFASKDLQSWFVLTIISGQGNSIGLNDYDFTDNNGFVYYKLSQTDYDGNTKEYSILHSDCESKGQKFSLAGATYQNEKFNLVINSNSISPVNLIISDINGRILKNEQFSGEQLQFDVPLALKAGLYLINIQQDDNSESKKVLINL